MYVHYQLTQYDKDHRFKKQYDREESRSFVKAFLQLVYCIMSRLSENIVDTSNTSRSVSFNPGSLSLGNLCDVGHPGLASEDDFVSHYFGISGTPDLLAGNKGIVVGTSTTAVAVADDNLVAPIANGSSAGQLVHYGCYGLNCATAASSASFDIERIFRNDSGGTITVNEIGMYAGALTTADNQTTDRAFCILRDVLGATISVLNGEYLKVKYTITVSN